MWKTLCCALLWIPAAKCCLPITLQGVITQEISVWIYSDKCWSPNRMINKILLPHGLLSCLGKTMSPYSGRFMSCSAQFRVLGKWMVVGTRKLGKHTSMSLSLLLLSNGLILPASADRWVGSIDGMLTGRGRVKYLEKNLFRCHSVHQKFQMDYIRIECGF
jgi:hypothetical protein